MEDKKFAVLSIFIKYIEYNFNFCVYFLEIMITKIFGADLPSKPIKSSGRELIIQFKSYLKTNGRLYVKNIHPQFLMSYWTEYNGKNNNYLQKNRILIIKLD